MFAAEAEGLRALRAADVRAPEPYAHGVRNGEAFIEMEPLALGGRPDWPAMARMLAALHRNTGERYGWETDNWIGLAPQKNGWRDNWGEFFWECRLVPQATKAGIGLEKKIRDLLKNHNPPPSLVHGDLWAGNAGFLQDGSPVIYDPAVYYGDREADLAMMELFGGFSGECFSAYQKIIPLEAGYETRKHLYNLYHLLNHLNLFGRGYLGQVEATLGLLLRAL